MMTCTVAAMGKNRTTPPVPPTLATVEATLVNNKQGWNRPNTSFDSTDRAVLSNRPVLLAATPIPQVAMSLATARNAAALMEAAVEVELATKPPTATTTVTSELLIPLLLTIGFNDDECVDGNNFLRGTPCDCWP